MTLTSASRNQSAARRKLAKPIDDDNVWLAQELTDLCGATHTGYSEILERLTHQYLSIIINSNGTHRRRL